MFTTVFVLFVNCVMLSVTHTNAEDHQKLEIKHQECGPNEVFNSCIGCPPEDSCYDRHQIACPAVILPCHSGCLCKEGFIRKTLDRECIPKEECETPCVIFEHYTECKHPSNETCSSIRNPPKSNGDSEEACTSGCACWDGFYRKDENSVCLHRCLCPDMKHSPDCADGIYLG